MSRTQFKITVGLLTGHFLVRNHLENIKLFNGDLDYRLRGDDTETVGHILCYCEAFWLQYIWSSKAY